MKNEEPINRVEVEQREWDKREEWFKETFKQYPKATSSRAFQIEKLEYYESIESKYINSQDANERLAARFLGEERRKLERALYPSATVRLLRKAFDLVSKPKIPTPFSPLSMLNVEDASVNTVKRQLIQAGFGSCVAEVENQISQGKTEFLIPASIYFKAGEKTDYKIGFKRDDDGKLQFLGFKITLDDKKESVSQRYGWDDNKVYTAKSAYNQLNGRAVAHSYSSGGLKQSSMSMLDFTDKDSSGNYRFKEFPLDFNYRSMIAALPLKDKGTDLCSKLEAGILNGNREQVTFLKSGVEQTFYIEANPGQKMLTIYDEHHKKISLKDAASINPMGRNVSENLANAKTEARDIPLDAKVAPQEPNLKVVKGTKKKTKVSVG